MAINFPSSSLNTNTSSLYTIDKFNGVDYTSTPTLVDETRATDISNYLPSANSLVKRNGWQVIHDMNFFNDNQNIIKNIWQIKFPKNNKVYYIILYYNTKSNLIGLFKSEELNLGFNFTNITKLNGEVFNIAKTTDNIKSYGIAFENRFFVLTSGKYIVISYNEEKENIFYEEVKNVAYVPTIVTGLDNVNSTTIATQLQEFNLLSNKCYIELIVDDREESNIIEGKQQTIEYNIGQFFNGSKSNIEILTINGDNVNDIAEYELQYDSSTGLLKLKKKDGFTGNFIRIKLLIQYTSEDYSMVENMSFGVAYGTKGYRDRLFLSGNPEYPNMDIHSCETNSEEGWLDYTYFGDMSYQFFGSNNTKVVGYGLLSNGNMAIFKESSQFEPNLYIRSNEFRQDSNNNYIETFPVEVSGIHIEIPNEANIITYGNNLLLNTPNGIYKLNLNTSTATQSYEALEMSYFIRNNLGTDISNTSWCVYRNKLYVSRYDKDGKRRVYVADEDRYSYIDNIRVYEWWALDDLDAENMYVFNDEMYFTSQKRGICKFKEDFTDEYTVKVSDVVIQDYEYSNGVFIDSDNDLIIIDKSNELLQELTKSKDLYNDYLNFKKTTRISFNNDIKVKLNFENIEYIGLNDDEGYGKFSIMQIKLKLNNPTLLSYIIENKLDLMIPIQTENNINEELYTLLSEYLEYDGEYYIIEVENENVFGTPIIESDLKFVIPKNTFFGINNLYETENFYSLEECKLENDVWYKEIKDENGIETLMEIGHKDYVYFNQITLSLDCIEIDFEWIEGTVANGVSFYVNKPVKSYWYSKFNDLGRLDFLKTIESITFVSDNRKGGYTEVGYRTIKNNVSYIIKESGILDFNDFDFNDVSFGLYDITRTHSSKKKIKNFSFMQLIFKSNYKYNSTIVSLALRYKNSRLNKGVK